MGSGGRAGSGAASDCGGCAAAAGAKLSRPAAASARRAAGVGSLRTRRLVAVDALVLAILPVKSLIIGLRLLLGVLLAKAARQTTP